MTHVLSFVTKITGFYFQYVFLHSQIPTLTFEDYLITSDKVIQNLKTSLKSR